MNKELSSIFNQKTAEERIRVLINHFGVEVVNLVIERHQLSSDKRNFFIVRWAEEDPEKEKKYTEEMDKLTKEISLIDEELYGKGIEKEWRLQILRDIKKVYPDQWEQGFVEKKAQKKI